MNIKGNQQNNQLIDVSSLPKGIYMLRTDQEEITKIYKI